MHTEAEMRTARQIEASRLNGARSRGDSVTDVGKRKSSRNSRRHGLYSKTVEPTDIPADVIEAIATFRAGIEAEYHSERTTTFTPDPDIENVIQAYGRCAQILALEKTVMEQEIARQKLIHPEASDASLQPIAFRRLADETGTLHLIDRLERRFSRQYHVALDRLSRRGPLKFAETNPAHTPEKTRNAETNPGTAVGTGAGKTGNAETNPS